MMILQVSVYKVKRHDSQWTGRDLWLAPVCGRGPTAPVKRHKGTMQTQGQLHAAQCKRKENKKNKRIKLYDNTTNVQDK